MVVLNDARKLCVRLEEKSARFVSEWMLPLVHEVVARADKADHSTPETASSSDSSRPVAKFNFLASDTPNIANKIYWQPGHHRYLVHVLLPEGTGKAMKNHVIKMSVDSKKSAEEYENVQVALCWKAVTTWNERDMSKRERIPTLREKFGHSEEGDHV